MSEINYMKRILVNSESKLDFSTEQCIEKLRVNLNYCGSDKKAILLTSSVPEEGKSFIAFNLWKSLAKSGKRVLLIDCDLRKSQMVKDFKFHFYENDQVTLADVLAEHDILQNAIYKTDVKNGYIIPTVTKISNASLLLSNGNFEKIITAAKKIFDYPR